MKKDLKSDLIAEKLKLSDPWYQLVLKMLESVVNDFNGQKLVEVGCGVGGFLINIARKGGTIAGLDLSANAVRATRDLVKRLQLQDRIDLVVGDAQFLPFRERCSNVVVSSETLEHVPDYEKAFGELLRITNKSGYVCLTVPNYMGSAIFENLLLLLVGQPSYIKSTVCVGKEHVFHIFKVKKLLTRNDIELVKIRTVDFLHLPPRVRRALGIGDSLEIVSKRLETFFENHASPLKYAGANIGVLARKK
jgi:2-polyprenyl-3-methyl-5-hydroxy-6-metoxy-1,4-benzoquinol methylase